MFASLNTLQSQLFLHNIIIKIKELGLKFGKQFIGLFDNHFFQKSQTFLLSFKLENQGLLFFNYSVEHLVFRRLKRVIFLESFELILECFWPRDRLQEQFHLAFITCCKTVVAHYFKFLLSDRRSKSQAHLIQVAIKISHIWSTCQSFLQL